MPDSVGSGRGSTIAVIGGINSMRPSRSAQVMVGVVLGVAGVAGAAGSLILLGYWTRPFTVVFIVSWFLVALAGLIIRRAPFERAMLAGAVAVVLAATIGIVALPDVDTRTTVGTLALLAGNIILGRWCVATKPSPLRRTP